MKYTGWYQNDFNVHSYTHLVRLGRVHRHGRRRVRQLAGVNLPGLKGLSLPSIEDLEPMRRAHRSEASDPELCPWELQRISIAFQTVHI